jgi:hypothetical protein
MSRLRRLWRRLVDRFYQRPHYRELVPGEEFASTAKIVVRITHPQPAHDVCVAPKDTLTIEGPPCSFSLRSLGHPEVPPIQVHVHYPNGAKLREELAELEREVFTIYNDGAAIYWYMIRRARGTTKPTEETQRLLVFLQSAWPRLHRIARAAGIPFKHDPGPERLLTMLQERLGKDNDNGHPEDWLDE